MQTQAPDSPGFGLIGSLRSFVDGLIGSVHDRIELLSVELQEEKHRWLQTFLWVGAIIVLGLLAMVFASVAVLVIFWDTARVAVVCGLAVAYGAAFVGAIVGFKRFQRRQPKPFAATLGELQEDRACLRNEA